MQDGAKEQEERQGAAARRRGDARERRGPGHGPPGRPPGAAAPRPRPAPKRGGLARAFGLAATLGLLAVGVAVALLVASDGGESAREAFAPTPSATATPARERRAKGPRGPRLTNAQRASRNAAVAQLRRQGFEPVSVSPYEPRRPLRVLIGRPKASTGVRGRRAFFFLREEYIGTDAAEPSLRLRVAGQRGDEITLAYK